MGVGIKVARLLAGLVKAMDRQRVNLGVNGFDPLDRGFDQLQRAQLATAQPRDSFGRGHTAKFIHVICHGGTPMGLRCQMGRHGDHAAPFLGLCLGL